MKIIYESNTGFTKQYAEIIEAKLNIDAYSLKEAKKVVNKKEDIIFLGWIKMGKIQGIKKAKRLYNVNYVVAVGITPPSDEFEQYLSKKNKVSCPLIYAPGGIDYNKLSAFDGTILSTMLNTSAKRAGVKDKEIYKLFNEGGSVLRKEYVDPVIRVMKNK